MNAPKKKDESKKPPVPDDTPPIIAARIIEQRSLLNKLRKLLTELEPEPNGG